MKKFINDNKNYNLSHFERGEILTDDVPINNSQLFQSIYNTKIIIVELEGAGENRRFTGRILSETSEILLLQTFRNELVTINKTRIISVKHEVDKHGSD